MPRHDIHRSLAQVNWFPEEVPCAEALNKILKPADPLPAALTTTPNSQLTMEWVYGVGTGTRHHVRYSSGGSIVYFSGSMGLCYNFPTEDGDEPTPLSQGVFLEHMDAIVSLAISAVGKVAATGDMSVAPKVLLWSTSTCKLQGMITGFPGPAATLDFSDDGSKLLSICADERLTLTIHHVESRTKLFTTSGLGLGLGPIFDGKWCTGGSGFALGTAKGILFFSGKGTSYEPKKGIAGSKAKVQSHLQ